MTTIADYIPKGAEGRITADDLSYLSCRTPREIRLEVNALRRAGTPIGSDIKGYFIAERAEDLNGTIESMTATINSMSEVIKGLHIAKEKLNET